MYCPACGKTNSAEQKFCRSCGLSLEKIVQALVEHSPNHNLDESLQERQRKVDLWLKIVGGSTVSIVVISVLFGIIYKLIIVKGEVLGGLIFLAFIVGIILFALLAIYGESLSKASSKRLSQKRDDLESANTGKLLSEGYLEPLPSVTERTTDLLAVEERVDKSKR